MNWCFARLGLLSLLSVPSLLHAEFNARDVKVLEWGFDTPTPADLLANQLQYRAQNPSFDGVILDLTNNSGVHNTGNRFGFLSWYGNALAESDYTDSINAVMNTDFSSLPNSFLQMNVVDGRVDWFDDTAFDTVLANARTLARVSRDAGMKGIWLDPEPYQFNLWDFNIQPPSGSTAGSGKTLVEYQAQVRERGRQFVQAVNAEFPDIEIGTQFGYSFLGEYPEAADPANGVYQLFAAFMDGLVEAAGPESTIHDGGNYAYWDRTDAEIQDFRRQSDQAVTTYASGPAQAKAGENYRQAFGIYMQGSSPWNTDDPQQNWRDPDQFFETMQSAVNHADEYVWIYNELTDWYGSDQNIPVEYRDALDRVKRLGSLERFDGPVIDAQTWQTFAQSASISNDDSLLITAINGTADAVARGMPVHVGQMVSVEITPLATDTYGLLGLFLTDNSGDGAVRSQDDDQWVSVMWTNFEDRILARHKSGADDVLNLLKSGDHPLGTTWIYQLHRLSLTDVEFSILDAAGRLLASDTLITPMMPADLFIGLYGQSADVRFDDVWITTVPEPACLVPILACAMSLMARRRARCSAVSSLVDGRKIMSVLRSFMQMSVVLVAAFAFTLVDPAPSLGAPPAPVKKLIHYGWEYPDTAYYRANASKMAATTPFSGVVLVVRSGPGPGRTGGTEDVLGWKVFGRERFTEEQIQHAIDDLVATPKTTLTDNFIQVISNPGSLDWFDDAAWESVLHNIGLMARVAKRGGCVGIMFDPEEYGHPLWTHAADAEGKTVGPRLTEYKTKLRERGKTFMAAINKEFPDIKILSLFGPSLALHYEKHNHVNYNLLPPFLEGMCIAASDGTRIIDGYELSYGFTIPEQFAEAREKMTVAARELFEDKSAFDSHMQFGFGLMMDYLSGGAYPWFPNDPEKNYFKPQQWTTSVRLALDAADEYVWIYTERTSWWPEGPGEVYQKATRAALEQNRSAEKSEPK